MAINARTLPEATPDDFEFRYIEIGAVGRGRLLAEPETMRFEASPSRARRLVSPGDTIVSTVRTYLRAVWPVSGETDDLVASTGFAVLSPMNGMDRGYLSWLAQSDAVIEEIVARSVGVSYPGINPLEIGEIKVSLPGVSDQRLIAGYLDIETKRLDGMRAFIRARQKLLEVRLRALIRADLAGYDRDAGPLRRYVTRVKTGATPSPAEAGDVPWYTPASFVDGLTIGAPIRWLPPDWVTDGTAVKFAPDSTLIVGIGATAGRVAHLDHVASGNQQLTCVEPGPRMLSRFLSWQLWAFGDELRGSASVTTLPIISNEVIRSFRVVVPSLDDQAHLVQGWERAATVTKALSQATRRLEGLLDERRRALITASVTGQLQLRGVAA